jgi:ribose 5-phosphate isomerase A
MVAQASRRMVVIVDETKLVERLGTRSPLPVEVTPFSWKTHIPFLESLGTRPLLRKGPNGEAFATDNGNYILDCRFSDGLSDPWAFQDALSKRAGIVESGLFLGLAQEILVGGGGGVRSITLSDRDAG